MPFIQLQPTVNPLDDLLRDIGVQGIQAHADIQAMAPDPYEFAPLQMDQTLLPPGSDPAQAPGADPVQEPGMIGMEDMMMSPDAMPVPVDPIEVVVSAADIANAPVDDELGPVSVPPVTSAADAMSMVTGGNANNLETASPDELARMNQHLAKRQSARSILEQHLPGGVGAFDYMTADDTSQYAPVPTVVNGRLRQYIPALGKLLPEEPIKPDIAIEKLADDRYHRIDKRTGKSLGLVAPDIDVENNPWWDTLEKLDESTARAILVNPDVDRGSQLYLAAYNFVAEPKTQVTETGQVVTTRPNMSAYDTPVAMRGTGDRQTRPTPTGQPAPTGPAGAMEIPQSPDSPYGINLEFKRQTPTTTTLEGGRVQVQQVPTAKMTEAENKSAGFADRAIFALQTLQAPASDGRPYFEHLQDFSERMGKNIQDFIGTQTIFDFSLNNRDFEVAWQAMEDWTRAVNRRESGAVLSEQEIRNTIENLAPTAGNSPEVLRRKWGALNVQSQSLIDSAGPNYRPNVQETINLSRPRDEDIKRQAIEAIQSLPDALLDSLMREERARRQRGQSGRTGVR